MWGATGLGVLFASFHSNAVPFYVMIIMVFLFGDKWNWVQTLGAFVVALGVIIAQLKSGKVKRSETALNKLSLSEV